MTNKMNRFIKNSLFSDTSKGIYKVDALQNRTEILDWHISQKEPTFLDALSKPQASSALKFQSVRVNITPHTNTSVPEISSPKALTMGDAWPYSKKIITLQDTVFRHENYFPEEYLKDLDKPEIFAERIGISKGEIVSLDGAESKGMFIQEADNDNDVIAFSSIIYRPVQTTKNTAKLMEQYNVKNPAYILKFLIHPDHRNNGLDRAHFNNLEEGARNKENDSLIFTVHDENTYLNKLVKDFGMEATTIVGNGYLPDSIKGGPIIPYTIYLKRL